MVGNLPGMLANIMVRIHASKDKLAPLTFWVIPVQPEGEDRVLYNPLFNHVLEDWRRPAHRNLRPAQSLQRVHENRAAHAPKSTGHRQAD